MLSTPTIRTHKKIVTLYRIILEEIRRQDNKPQKGLPNPCGIMIFVFGEDFTSQVISLGRINMAEILEYVNSKIMALLTCPTCNLKANNLAYIR